MAKVDLTSFNNQMALAVNVGKDIPLLAYKEFIKHTPIKTGNARRHTQLDSTRITADYPYSERLDQGYSKQSPDGMVKPTTKFIQQEVDRRLKGL